MKDRILSKAAEDARFRAQLIADPRLAIWIETGASIPEGFELVVHEDSATTAHLVLPPSGELTEDDLKAVAGDPSAIGNWNP